MGSTMVCPHGWPRDKRCDACSPPRPKPLSIGHIQEMAARGKADPASLLPHEIQALCLYVSKPDKERTDGPTQEPKDSPNP